MSLGFPYFAEALQTGGPKFLDLMQGRVRATTGSFGLFSASPQPFIIFFSGAPQARPRLARLDAPDTRRECSDFQRRGSAEPDLGLAGRPIQSLPTSVEPNGYELFLWGPPQKWLMDMKSHVFHDPRPSN